MQDILQRVSVALAHRYRIDREVGRGGMALVFLAEEHHPRRKVAIKVLDESRQPMLGPERFLREVDLASKLTHPNILPIFAAGEADGLLYYVMPFVEGESLRERLTRERQLRVEDAIQIASEVADALSYAHDQGIVHRDVKPENILLPAGHAVVADFGIARALSAARTGGGPLTSPGTAIGTPAYMSPEQGSGDPADARADIYALGCVVYEMLAGEPPFRGASDEVVLRRHAIEPVPSLRVVRPTLPRHVVRAIETALAKTPADRFATSSAFGAALRGGSAGSGWKIPRWLRNAVAATVILGIPTLVFAWNRLHPRLALGERDWVLVADFSGPEDEPSLAATVRELVTAELNQSRFLSTVSRQQLNSVMRMAGIAETTYVDAELARELAVRSAVRAIVAGNVQRIGEGRYSIAIHVVDADDGRNVQSRATTATQAGMVDGVQEVARQLRRDLGEREQAIAATMPLRQAATPSFSAYTKHVEALVRSGLGDVLGSNALLQEAIEEDSGFAAAWVAIGANYLGARKLDSAQLAFARALAIPNRLTDAQRYRLQADIAYTIRYDVPAAIRWYDLYLAEYPRSFGGRNNRALYLSSLGRYEDAVADLRAAVAANPFGSAQVQIMLFNQAAMLTSLGRFDEAATTIRELGDPLRPGASALLAVARGRWAEAESIGVAIEGDAEVHPFAKLLATTGRASGLAARGSLDAAASVLQEARAHSTGATARWYDRAGLLLATAQGRPVLRGAGPRPADASAGAAVTGALIAAVTGDTLSAREELRRHVDGASPREQALLGQGPALVRGWIAAAGGRWGEVTESLAEAALVGEHDATLLDRVSSLEIRWLVADAYAARGRLDSAVLQLEKGISPDRVPAGHLVLRGLALTAAHARLGTWWTAMGDRERARRYWSLVLAEVTQPDPELRAVLIRARESLATLERTH